MSARRQIIAALSEDSMGGIATLHDVAHAEQLVDAYRTEVLAEAKTEVVAWLVKKASEGCNTGALASKVDRGAVRIFLGTGHYRDAMDAHRVEVLAEAADYVDNDDECDCGGCDTCIPRKLAEGLRALAGEKATDAQSATATPELTVYRASHDSIVMGLYTTAAAAREHCETLMRRESPDTNLDWIEDEEDDIAELTAWLGGEECVTGYVVTALPVASAYDEEADE
jgi:hypothetical protein